ncbi:rhamnulokinase [Vibrio sp. qd031]|uniref:rhamnulokinase n=1 Tax=Vibrio sp. qd031 TaxID=1603038 RepID=UPI000A102A4F|nr:rhamnulokinase [Vibrio sp. qd031]ORT52279.1 rhamnulokinase [Vibrio sp. qd031]
MNYFLAIDIGASSGRHLLGHLDKGELKLEEVYRFSNEISNLSGELCWDLDYLFTEIIAGLKKCKKLGKAPTTLGIDTWGVDFVLLDESDRPLGNAVSYRDKRTSGVMTQVSSQIGSERLYAKTGIQFMDFNTICQLTQTSAEYKTKAKSFLMIPDYLNYLLTGKKVNEYTNATTTQLYNVENDDWDEDLIRLTGLNKDVFSKALPPLTKIGGLQQEIIDSVGFDCEVILPPTHDTGSAFIASMLDIEDDGVILSSGTWSLLGMELFKPILTENSRLKNFTNEGGFDKRFRFLKNIMGLWIIQEVARNLENRYSFAELAQLAKEASDFKSTIDVSDERFFVSDNMIEEIVSYCKVTNQVPPKSVGEVSVCVYRSLAICYAKHINEITDITGKNVNKINIIGGGCKNQFLNELIREETNKEVIVGPVEATGIGNIVTQMIAVNEIDNLSSAKQIIRQSAL